MKGRDIVKRTPQMGLAPVPWGYVRLDLSDGTTLTIPEGLEETAMRLISEEAAQDKEE